LHFPAQDFVDMSLVLPTARSKPGQNVGINSKTDLLLYRPVESAYLNARGDGLHRRGIRVVNFGIQHSGETLQFPSLAIRERTRKERARGEPPF
jgi:hypothetical protein